MADGIYVALSSALRETQTLDNVAENVANVATPGYQAVKLQFRAQLARATDKNPIHFASTQGSVLDMRQGLIRQTGKPLDVVLPRGAFLAVQGEDGSEKFTRAGSLVVSPNGELRTASGFKVFGEGNGGQIVKVDPAGPAPSIGEDGSVLQAGNSVGRLRLTTFERPELLQREGANVLSASATAGARKVPTEPLVVGALEEANTMREMSNLIAATRAFEASQKTLEAFREIDRSAASKLPGAQ